MLLKLEQLLTSTELPEILHQKPNTLDITYAPPHVERLWWQWGEYRISFHHLERSMHALWHPHTWPAAFAILRGSYEHRIGYVEGATLGEKVPANLRPEVLTTQILADGSHYEMTNPRAFHSVRPYEPTYTLMVSGRPWSHAYQTASRPLQAPLSDVRAAELQALALKLL